MSARPVRVTPNRRYAAPEPGERIGLVVALKDLGRDATGHPRWLWQCDCGERINWRVATIRGNNEREIASCGACYKAREKNQPPTL